MAGKKIIKAVRRANKHPQGGSLDRFKKARKRAQEHPQGGSLDGFKKARKEATRHSQSTNANKGFSEKTTEDGSGKSDNASDNTEIPNNKEKIAEASSTSRAEQDNIDSDDSDSVGGPNGSNAKPNTGPTVHSENPQVAPKGGGGGSDKGWWDKYHMTTLVGLGTLGAAALAASSAFGGPMSNSQLYADPLGGY